MPLYVSLICMRCVYIVYPMFFGLQPFDLLTTSLDPDFLPPCFFFFLAHSLAIQRCELRVEKKTQWRRLSCCALILIWGSKSIFFLAFSMANRIEYMWAEIECKIQAIFWNAKLDFLTFHTSHIRVRARARKKLKCMDRHV